MDLNIIILAAGKGSRMRTNTPKVLHKLGDKPLLEHVLQTAQKLQPKKIHIVHGSDGEEIRKYFEQFNINWIEQKEKLGTGHAVKQALPHIDKEDQVLILYGDVPLVTKDTLEQLVKDKSANSLNLLSAEFSDPTGFGRIIRDDLGNVKAIIEHKDASATEQKIKEINSGILTTTAEILQKYLPQLRNDNVQQEYYLTDIVAMLKKDNIPINCLLVSDPLEVTGINDQKQLAKSERIYQKKMADLLMSQGLNLIDPDRFDIRGNLAIEKNITIDINVIIEGEVSIGANTIISPNTILKNVRVGKNVIIKANCVIEDTIIDDNCIVGPFARIRPGSHLEEGSQVGNFVEMKKTRIGKNSKANHLSYLGDSIIGKNVNIGAGTITCNYDGTDKHQTTIKDSAFIGSNTSLVAPVTIGKGATIGAGSVITENAPEKELTLSRTEQRTIKNWQHKNKFQKEE